MPLGCLHRDLTATWSCSYTFFPFLMCATLTKQNNKEAKPNESCMPILLKPLFASMTALVQHTFPQWMCRQAGRTPVKLHGKLLFGLLPAIQSRGESMQFQNAFSIKPVLNEITLCAWPPLVVFFSRFDNWIWISVHKIFWVYLKLYSHVFRCNNIATWSEKKYFKH